jgi:hypothetical protein
MQSMNFQDCTGLTGAVDKLVLPDGMQSVNFQSCTGLTAPPGCPRGSSYDFNYNEDNINRLRSWISLTATQGGAAGEDGNEGKAGGHGEGATEMEALRAFAESVGYNGDIMDGVVTECAGGAIEEIHWKSKNLDGTLPVGDQNMSKLRVLDLSNNSYLKGDLTQLHLPVGMNDLNLGETKVSGDIGQLNLPVGMQSMNFQDCTGLTGAVDKLVLSVGMQSVSFEGCHGLTGDVTQLRLPDSMRSFNPMQITGDLTQMNLPVGMQNLYLGGCHALTGVVDKLVLPEGMQNVDFAYCTGLTGDVAQLHLPVGMKNLNLRGCSALTAPPGCPRGFSPYPIFRSKFSYENFQSHRILFNYNEADLNRLRSWVSLTATRGGAAGEDGNEGKAGGDGDGATEMEALRAFAESVGYKGDIMDDVVTECAGGAIKEIHWGNKDLDGTLPVGDLNMPKLRMMDVSGNTDLEGDLCQMRFPVGIQTISDGKNASII